MRILWVVLVSQLLTDTKSYELYQKHEAVTDKTKRADDIGANQHLSTDSQQFFIGRQEKSSVRRRRLRPPLAVEEFSDNQQIAVENKTDSSKLIDSAEKSHLNAFHSTKAERIINNPTTAMDIIPFESTSTQKTTAVDDDKDIADQVGRYLKTEAGKSSKVQLCELLFGLCPRIRELLERNEEKLKPYTPPCKSSDEIANLNPTTTTTTTAKPAFSRCKPAYTLSSSTISGSLDQTTAASVRSEEGHATKPNATFRNSEKIGKTDAMVALPEPLSTTTSAASTESIAAATTTTAEAKETTPAESTSSAATTTIKVAKATEVPNVKTVLEILPDQSREYTTTVITNKWENRNSENLSFQASQKQKTYEGVIEVSKKYMNVGDTYGMKTSSGQNFSPESQTIKPIKITTSSQHSKNNCFSPDVSGYERPFSSDKVDEGGITESPITVHKVHPAYTNYERQSTVTYPYRSQTMSTQSPSTTIVNIESIRKYDEWESSDASNVINIKPESPKHNNWKPAPQPITNSGSTYLDWPPNSRSRVIDLRPVQSRPRMFSTTTQVPLLQQWNNKTPYTYKVVEETFGTQQESTEALRPESTQPELEQPLETKTRNQQKQREHFMQFTATTTTPSVDNLLSNVVPMEERITIPQHTEWTNSAPSLNYELENFKKYEIYTSPEINTASSTQQTPTLLTTSSVLKNTISLETPSTTAKPESINVINNSLKQAFNTLPSGYNPSEKKKPETIVEEVHLETSTPKENLNQKIEKTTNPVYGKWPVLLTSNSAGEITTKFDNYSTTTSTTTLPSTESHIEKMTVTTTVEYSTEAVINKKNVTEDSTKVSGEASTTAKSSYELSTTESTPFPTLNTNAFSTEGQVLVGYWQEGAKVEPLHQETWVTTVPPYTKDKLKTVYAEEKNTYRNIPTTASSISESREPITSYTLNSNKAKVSSEPQITTMEAGETGKGKVPIETYPTDENWPLEYRNYNGYYTTTPKSITNSNNFIAVAPSDKYSEENYDLTTLKQQKPSSESKLAEIKELWAEKLAEHNTENPSESLVPFESSSVKASTVEITTKLSSTPVEVLPATKSDSTIQAMNVQEQVKNEEEFVDNSRVMTRAPNQITARTDRLTEVANTEESVKVKTVKNPKQNKSCKYSKNSKGELTCEIDDDKGSLNCDEHRLYFDKLLEVNPSNLSAEIPLSAFQKPFKTASIVRAETSENTELLKHISTIKPYQAEQSYKSYELIDTLNPDEVNQGAGYKTEVSPSSYFPHEKVNAAPETVYEVHPPQVAIG
uniref:Serine-rich adhesin for platelets n=1 Tax=Syphacia muris TaxID=451379 RepID=A0A0N5AY22_9BILA